MNTVFIGSIHYRPSPIDRRPSLLRGARTPGNRFHLIRIPLYPCKAAERQLTATSRLVATLRLLTESITALRDPVPRMRYAESTAFQEGDER